MNAPHAGKGRPAPGLTRRRMLEVLGSAALLPFAGGLAGCSTRSRPEAQGDLDFVYLGDINQRAQFEALFAEFNEQHPEIALAASGKSGSWAQFVYAVATQIAGGQPPDIVQIATEGQRLFASKGVLAPLDDLIAADQAEVDEYYDDIHDKLRTWTQRYGSPDEHTYYVPGGYNPIVQFCHTELLDRAGVEVPDDGWHWDDLMTAGRKVKAQGAFLMTVQNGYWHDVLPWLTNNGTSSLDADWREATINSPEAVEAAEMARALVKAGYAPDPGGSYDPPTLMQQGRLASFHDGAFGIVNADRIGLTDKIQVVDFPNNGVHGTPVGWDAWDITDESQHTEDAWTFIKYLMSRDAGEFYARTGGTIVPARRSVARGDAFLGGAPRGSERLVDALELEYATPVPSPERGPEIQDAVEEGWLQVVSGYSDARSQLNRTYDKIGPLL
ncbi:ABC transporter substrate-binding protein [Isoptericola sp. NPDC056573]|uniref:ABC transporter substrate-binding protein n=1 Tax=Isoptericola sp. NPDC056573 TaxID=3345868 RepID=UPI003690163E